MPSSTNVWMVLAGLVYLVVGIFILRKQISAARGWDKLITLAALFIGVSLATFAPEHFANRGPDYIQMMAPAYMPVRWFWPDFIGCVLLAAATSLTLRKFMRLSSTLLGLMFFLFICMIYFPSVLRHLHSRPAWTIMLRDLSFCAGAWALAGMYWRASLSQQTKSRQLSKSMILFSRMVFAIVGIFYGVVHFLHPMFAPGVPLGLPMPSWVPFPSVWGYLAGAILLAAGICLALNIKSRMAAASIGTLATGLTVFLYVPILILAYCGGSVPAINEGINYVADTLLFAGSVLALASALAGGKRQVL